MNQEQEVESEERCKEEVAQLNATIERGVPDGKEVCVAVGGHTCSLHLTLATHHSLHASTGVCS